jgi:ribosome assembly protein YihI (activator of Der GTPase)
MQTGRSAPENDERFQKLLDRLEAAEKEQKP